METTEYIILVGFLGFEITLLSLIFSRRIIQILRSNTYYKIIIFIAIQPLVGLLVIAGGYFDNQYNLFSNLRNTVYNYRKVQVSPTILPTIEGDPGLIKWVSSKRASRPDFSSPQRFLSWQSNLRKKLHDVFEFPDPYRSAHTRLQELASVKVVNGIIRTFFTFESFDGTTVPGYLFTPPSDVSNNIKKPAILVLSGHVDLNEEGITQTAGLLDSYQHGAALELAKAGFVTLTMEFRGFGYLGSRINTEHKLVAYNAILGGSFYKAVISKDIKYAIDLLYSLPVVDSARIGITGVSYGGEMALTYAALDERIKVIVANGFIGLGQKLAVSGFSTPQPHYCHVIPGYNSLMYQEDLYYLIAPRPLLSVKGDDELYLENGENFSGLAGKAHTILNVASDFKFQIMVGGHEYFLKPSIRFFKKHL